MDFVNYSETVNFSEQHSRKSLLILTRSITNTRFVDHPYTLILAFATRATYSPANR